MNLKCHFDANGWLQGPISITHMTALTPNRYDSGFAIQARGLVQHTEDGFEAGTVETFMNPASQASAFFSVDELGNCHQYLPVGQGYRAWAQAAGNTDWRSCECEDKTRTGDPMTGPQLTAFAQILEACSAYDGFPLQITDDPANGHGLITHGDGGVAWGNHPDCPGNTRKAQRPQIIALAKAIRQGSQPAPKPAARRWVTAGISSLAQLARDHGTTPAVILALTAGHSPGGVYGAGEAAFIDALCDGTVTASEPMPKGLTLYLPG